MTTKIMESEEVVFSKVEAPDLNFQIPLVLAQKTYYSPRYGPKTARYSDLGPVAQFWIPCPI